jgi:hypothetical protein
MRHRNIEILVVNIVLKKGVKKIQSASLFFMPHFRMGQTNSSLELFQGTTYET